MDIMFDQKLLVEGEDLPVSLPLENVIFVMEDVDAASPIVRSRERTGGRRKQQQKKRASAAATAVNDFKVTTRRTEATVQPPLLRRTAF